MAFKYFDITPVISEKLGVFPGDTSFQRETLLSFEKANHLLLSTIKTTVHLGAHTDSPAHYHAQGATIEQVALDPFIGPALVVTAKTPRGQRVILEDLELPKDLPSRVLIRTNSFPDPENWNSDFSSLSARLIDELARRGVTLVGIDTPSVDPETSKELESHNALYRNDLRVLEGIVLSGVPDGDYYLIALPLPLKGLDASPVRAILLPRESQDPALL